MTGLASLAGVIAVVVGGIFGAYEYADRKEMQRAAETLRMIEIWETRGAQEAYLALSSSLEAKLRELPQSQTQDLARADILRDNLARRALREHPGAYDQVVYFFTRLSLCIEAALCSEPVARTFFSDSLDGFLSWFESEITRRRVLSKSHAEELDVLSGLFANPDFRKPALP